MNDLNERLVSPSSSPSTSTSGNGSMDYSQPRSRIPLRHLDSFLRDVYTHFRMRGFLNIVLSKVLNLLLLMFLAGIAMFLIHFVNYDYLLGKNELPLIKSWSDFHPHWVTITIWALLLAIFIIQTISLIESAKTHREISLFYKTWLGIAQKDLEYIRWADVVEKITHVGSIMHGSTSALDIISRITRKENYMIAMINKNVLDLTVPFLPSFLGGGSPLISEMVEWSLWFSLFSVNFGDEGIINDHMPSDQWTKALKRRFLIFGVLIWIFSPIIIAVLLIYFSLRYGEQIRSDPTTTIIGRKWSPLARWKLREINEVHHLFDQRLRKAYLPATEYLSQFPTSSSLVVIAKFFTFLFGAMLLILLGFSFISSRFVFEIWGLSSVFWITVLTAAISACRSILPPESQSFDFEPSLKTVSKYTHHLPLNWIGKAHTHEVFEQVSSLFQFKLILWIREGLSVFVLPLVCFFSLPKCAENIVIFFKTFTTYKSEVGNICTFSLLLISDNNNSNTSSSSSSTETEATAAAAAAAADHSNLMLHLQLNDGKLEKSFLNFYANYPFWEIPNEGKVLLERLKDFEEQRKQRKEQERTRYLDSSALASFGGTTENSNDSKRDNLIESLTQTHLDFFAASVSKTNNSTSAEIQLQRRGRRRDQLTTSSISLSNLQNQPQQQHEIQINVEPSPDLTVSGDITQKQQQQQQQQQQHSSSPNINNQQDIVSVERGKQDSVLLDLPPLGNLRESSDSTEANEGSQQQQRHVLHNGNGSIDVGFTSPELPFVITTQTNTQSPNQ